MMIENIMLKKAITTIKLDKQLLVFQNISQQFTHVKYTLVSLILRQSLYPTRHPPLSLGNAENVKKKKKKC